MRSLVCPGIVYTFKEAKTFCPGDLVVIRRNTESVSTIPMLLQKGRLVAPFTQRASSQSYSCFMGLCNCVQYSLAAPLKENSSQLRPFVCSVIVEVRAGDCRYSRLRSHFTGEGCSARMSALIEAKAMMKLLDFLRES